MCVFNVIMKILQWFFNRLWRFFDWKMMIFAGVCLFCMVECAFPFTKAGNGAILKHKNEDSSIENEDSSIEKWRFPADGVGGAGVLAWNPRLLRMKLIALGLFWTDFWSILQETGFCERHKAYEVRIWNTNRSSFCNRSQRSHNKMQTTMSFYSQNWWSICVSNDSCIHCKKGTCSRCVCIVKNRKWKILQWSSIENEDSSTARSTAKSWFPQAKYTLKEPHSPEFVEFLKVKHCSIKFIPVSVDFYWNNGCFLIKNGCFLIKNDWIYKGPPEPGPVQPILGGGGIIIKIHFIKW